VLDWLDPPMAAGHWVPAMLELAGAEPVLVEPGAPSRRVDGSAVVDADPEVLVAAPCGFDRERAARETDVLARRDGWSALTAARQGRVVAMDANAYTARPGPRLVDGLEQLAVAVHGDALAEAYPKQAERLERV
jgi:iron complex transport system substrate-binding protein